MMDSDYFQIFQQMPCGVLVTDLQGRIERANPLATVMLDIGHHPETAPNLDSLLSKGNLTGATASFAAVKDRAVTFHLRLADRTLRLTGWSITIGPKGVKRAMVITIEDVTIQEYKLSEDKKRERHVVMGELSADIAHEFRNPLGSIELLASLLRKELKRKKDVKRAEQILAAVRNMENKISSLIQFSKIYQIPVCMVNLHDILREILRFSEMQTNKDLPFITTHFADCEPVVECNPDMMKQVFVTLILNTLQSLSVFSRLDIETHHLGDQRLIEVHFIERTTGSRDAIHANVLDRFAQAKESNWGLGLAIIHNIINMYRGSLRLEYLQSVGNSFVLTFPLATGETGPLATMP